MSLSAMLIDVPGVLTPDTDPLLRRMHLAGVPVLLFDDDGVDLAPFDASTIAAVVAPSGFPRPKALLLACREHDVDLASSWMITARAKGLEAASQAGLPQAAWIGDGALPDPSPPIRIERARDLADAPRVMVPREGGCWHDHR